MGSFVENVNKLASDLTNDLISDITAVAGLATQMQEIVDTVIPNIDEILLADGNAVIATTKALEALTSANNADTSEANALTSANNADISEANALSYKNSAETSATTATTQANISLISASMASNSQVSSALSASNAKLSEEVVLDYVAVYSTNFHNGEFISNDNTTSEDFGTIVGSISPFSAEATTAYRTDLAISSGSIDCGSL